MDTFRTSEFPHGKKRFETKERDIAVAYVTGGTRAAAAKLTGLSEPTVNIALARPAVQEFVRDLNVQIDKNTFRQVLRAFEFTEKEFDYALRQIIESPPHPTRGYGDILRALRIAYKRLAVPEISPPLRRKPISTQPNARHMNSPSQVIQ